jgi:hypothetical protein
VRGGDGRVRIKSAVERDGQLAAGPPHRNVVRVAVEAVLARQFVQDLEDLSLVLRLRAVRGARAAVGSMWVTTCPMPGRPRAELLSNAVAWSCAAPTLRVSSTSR